MTAVSWRSIVRDEAWTRFRLEPGALMEFEGRLRGGDGAPINSLVVRLRLFDGDGNALDVRPNDLSCSPAAGLYFYPLKHLEDGGFRRAVARPEGVVEVELSVQTWARHDGPGFELGELNVRAVAPPQPEPKPQPVPALRAPAAESGGHAARRLRRMDRELRRDMRLRVAEALSDWNRPLYPGDAEWIEAVGALLVERGDRSLARRLVRRWMRAGRISEAERFAEVAQDPQLYRELGRRALAADAARHVGRRARRFRFRAPGVLYLLHNTLPFHTGGYAARAQGLLQGFQRAGWETYPVARAGYPGDRADTGEATPPVHDHSGVAYRFLRQDVSIEQADQLAYVQAYADAVLEAVPHERIGVVQAASFYHNAFAGRLVADRLGVPLVYEMRGLEWFTRGSKEPRWLESEQAALSRDLELRAAHAADLVFAITGALRDWLIDNGVPARKIALLPNGCTADRFTPRPKNEAFARELGLQGAFVVGYIGSVVFYEGVDLIVQAVRRARDLSGRDIRFLLVGDGPGMASVERAIAETGGEAFVIAPGRVPHEQVEDYYSVVDALVLARTDLPVCQAISPLKPVEAMAMGKPLITSDVAAIKEMIDASGAGLLYPAGDVEALAGRILEMAASEPLRAELAARGRAWAVETRDWSALAAGALADIGDRLFQKSKAAAE